MTCSFKRLLSDAVQFNLSTRVTLHPATWLQKLLLSCHLFNITRPQVAPISNRTKNQSKLLNHTLTLNQQVSSVEFTRVMAFRSVGHLRSLLGGLRGSATYATSTTQKAKAYAPTADYGHFQDLKGSKTRALLKGDFVPVYVAVGMITLSVSLGLLTAKHHILYSPGVRVKKKTRETLPEVEDPDKVLDESERFLKKSFFRKVAHVQEFDHVVPDPIRKDVFAYKPKAETLKSVGIDPKIHV